MQNVYISKSSNMHVGNSQLIKLENFLIHNLYVPDTHKDV